MTKARTKLRAFIVDDEEDARVTLRSMLSLYCSDIELCGEASDLEGAINYLPASKADVVFLDIHLKDRSGFELFQRLSDLPRVIFVTAYDRYAIEAFKVNAIDYLLKPIDPDDLIRIEKKLHDLNSNSDTAEEIKSFAQEQFVKGSTSKLVLSSQNEHLIIDVNDIVRCEADGGYTDFHLLSGQRYTTSTPLKEYAIQLSSSKFLRPHQSHLVNVDQIDRITKADGSTIILKNGDAVPISRRKKTEIMEFIAKL